MRKGVEGTESNTQWGWNCKRKIRFKAPEQLFLCPSLPQSWRERRPHPWVALMGSWGRDPDPSHKTEILKRSNFLVITFFSTSWHVHLLQRSLCSQNGPQLVHSRCWAGKCGATRGQAAHRDCPGAFANLDTFLFSRAS